MKSLTFPYDGRAYRAFTNHWHAHMDALSVARGARAGEHHVHASRETPHMNIATMHERERRIGEDRAAYDARLAAVHDDIVQRAANGHPPRPHDGYAEVTIWYDETDDDERALADEFTRAFKGA